MMMKATQMTNKGLDTLNELMELADKTANINKRVASNLLTFFRATFLAFLLICLLNERWDYILLSSAMFFLGSFTTDAVFIKHTGLMPMTFIDIMKTREATVSFVIYCINKFDRNPLFSLAHEKDMTKDDDTTGRT